MSVRSALDGVPSAGRVGDRYALPVLLGVGVFAVLNLVPILVVRALPGHRPSVSMWYPGAALVLGLLVVGGGVLAVRRDHLDPRVGLGVVVLGLAFVTLAGDGLIQFSAVGVPGTQYRPGVQPWYRVVDTALGVGVMLGSLAVGFWQWPDRPRYALLGVALGGWLLYPGVFRNLAGVSLASPEYLLGVLLVFAVPVLVAYVLVVDAAPVLRRALSFPAARAFGASVTAVTAAYVAFSTGMIANIPDEGVGLSWTHVQWAAAPIVAPVVEWPAVEYWIPQLPVNGFVSVGMVVLVATMSVLFGLVAAVTAAAWVSGSGRGGVGGAASGLTALAGTNACCCCGPVVPQVAVLLLGPSAASPLFWTFVSPTSPVGVSFLVLAIGLVTRTLVATTAT